MRGGELSLVCHIPMPKGSSCGVNEGKWVRGVKCGSDGRCRNASRKVLGSEERIQGKGKA